MGKVIHTVWEAMPEIRRFVDEWNALQESKADLQRELDEIEDPEERRQIYELASGLAAVMKKHEDSCDWKEGKAVEVFEDEGVPCVKYESGNWWHYDIERGRWW